MGACIVRVPPCNLSHLSLTDSVTRTKPKGHTIPDLSPEVADTGLEAVLLQGAVFLLLFGVEEVLSNAPEEKSGLWHRFNSLSDSFLGFW